ncbi:MAG: Ig-like domain-containing protein, partial [Coriobacteriia bacterium]|nr:Ig-like domain-containing protein [Coriobacteriia bacterium]
TFTTHDLYKVDGSGLTKDELVSANALVAYEQGVSGGDESSLTGIRDAGGIGVLRLFTDVGQVAQQLAIITVSAPTSQPAAEEFVFEVTVPAGGTFAIPTSGPLNGTNMSNLYPTGVERPYNWNINWGDGSAEQTIASTDTGAPPVSLSSVGIPHTYTNAGTYTITITPNGSEDAWLGAFGFHSGTTGASTAANKALVTKVVSPLTLAMTRTEAQISGSAAPPNLEWVNTFYGCTNLTMGPDFKFSDEWDEITTVGNFFANNTFWGCNSPSFTMNEVFNLPAGLTSVGSGFGGGMFASCTGTTFTMNEVFNLPSGIDTVTASFAQTMFNGCNGAAFTMNDVFTFPVGITEVGDSFAARMFAGCNGAAFNMNEVFNFPQTVTASGGAFAQYMFENCWGTAFTMNDIFNLPSGMTSFTGSGGFATNMFANCRGPAFTMNDVFTLPTTVTNPGASFATAMFSGCSGDAFTMGAAFNLPSNSILASTTSGFASSMFNGCSGAAFTMNDIFNLPQGITTAGATFAYRMFYECTGNSFKVNDVFTLPTLVSASLGQLNSYVQTFANLGNNSLQTRTATSIIGGNATPTAQKNTFANSACFTDRSYIPVNWGGDGLEPPMVVLEVYDAAVSTTVPAKSFTLADLEAIATAEGGLNYSFAGYNTFGTYQAYATNSGPTLGGILTDALAKSDLAGCISDGYNVTATAYDGFASTFSKTQLTDARYYYPSGATITSGVAPSATQLMGATQVPSVLSLPPVSRLFIGQLGPSEQTRAIFASSMVRTSAAQNIPKITVNSSATGVTAEDLVILNNASSIPAGTTFELADAASPASVLNLRSSKIYYTTDGSAPSVATSAMYNYNTNSNPAVNTPISAPATPGSYTLKMVLYRYGYADQYLEIPFVVPYASAPIVTSLSPTGADVATSGSISITFDRAMDTSVAGSVQLGSLPALGAGSWSAEDTVYTVSYAGLDNATSYTVHVSGFKDSLGAAMTADSTHSFTTAAAPVVTYTITITNSGAEAGDTAVTLSSASGVVGGPITLNYVLGDDGGKPINTLTFTGASGLSPVLFAGASTSQTYYVTASDAVDGAIAIIAMFTHTDLASQIISFPDSNAGVTKTFGEPPFINEAMVIGDGGSGAITYLSSNPSVASVDSMTGAVTIVGAGSATISATKSACDAYAETTASYVLTVNNAAQSVPVGLGKTDETAVGASDGTITGVDGSMEFSVDGTSFSPIFSSSITDLAPGTYFVRYAAKQNYDASASVSLTIAAYSPPPVYVLTVISGTGSGTYEAGTSVTIVADSASEGKIFDRWTGGEGGTFSDTTASTTTFTMPASAVTVTATYKDVGVVEPIKYSVITNFGLWSGSGDAKGVTDGPSEKFFRLVLLNTGEVIDPGNYLVEEGGVIYLKEAYLKTFAPGTYMVRAEYTDGYAEFSFIIPVGDEGNGKGPDSTPRTTPSPGASTGNPKTGDDTNAHLWITFIALSGAMIVASVRWSRKREMLS